MFNIWLFYVDKISQLNVIIGFVLWSSEQAFWDTLVVIQYINLYIISFAYVLQSVTLALFHMKLDCAHCHKKLFLRCPRSPAYT